MNPKFYVVIWLFFLPLVSGEILIIEVMYDYPGADTKHEWIEIYNSASQPTNLSGWKLREEGTDHQLSLIKGEFVLQPQQYAVIADDSLTFLADNHYSNLTLFNSTLFESSFSLSNNGEELVLKDKEGNLIFNLTYNPILGAGGNNRTLCFLNNAWQEGLATPGEANQIDRGATALNQTLPPEEAKNLSFSVYLSQMVYLGTEYTQLFRIEIKNKENCSKKDNFTVSYNITQAGSLIKEELFTREIGCSGYSSTGEFTPNTKGNYTLCGRIIQSTFNKTRMEVFACRDFTVLDTSLLDCNVSINLTTEETLIYPAGQSVKFKPGLSNKSFPFTIEYWIEDLFGRIYKSKTNTTNTDQKSWQSNIEEEDRVLIIKAKVYPNCNDSNLTDNQAEKMIVVTNAELKTISSLNIEELYLDSNDKIKWGNQFTAKVNVYKGDESKYSVQLWAEKEGKKISQTTKLNLYDKYKNYPLTLPVQLIPNCRQKISDDKATLVLEAFGLRAEEGFSVEGLDKEVCKNYLEAEEPEEQEKKRELSYQLVELPGSLSAGEVLRLKIQMIGDGKEHDFKVWSYLYRGSKCYSCMGGKNQENNRIEFKLKGEEVKQAELLLKIDDEAEEGVYKLKVKLNKDNQKTNNEITEEIYIKKNKEESMKGLNETLDLLGIGGKGFELGEEKTSFLESDNRKKEIASGIKGIVIYQSSTEKSKQLIPYLLIVTLSLLSLILILKKI